MCRIGGFALDHNKYNSTTRFTLVNVLGRMLDSGGGHAAGFVSIASNRIRCGKRIGEWKDSKDRFVRMAASGNVCMMHARYATCGGYEIDAAHPFTIRRDNKSVLYGIHNGVIYDADDSAKAHGREYTVDSKEIFELIADKEYGKLNQLHGYGVINWIDAKDPTHIKLAKLSEDGEIYVASLKGGGMVWASTWSLLSPALAAARLEAEKYYTIDVGQVYTIDQEHIRFTDNKDCKLAEGWGFTGWQGNRFDLLSDDDFLTDEEFERKLLWEEYKDLVEENQEKYLAEHSKNFFSSHDDTLFDPWDDDFESDDGMKAPWEERFLTKGS